MDTYHDTAGRYETVRFQVQASAPLSAMRYLDDLEGRAPGTAMTDNDWVKFNIALQHQANFWMALIAKVDHSEISNVRCMQLGARMFAELDDGAETRWRDVIDAFGSLEEDAESGGALFTVKRYERLDQLQEVVAASERLANSDFRYLLHERLMKLSASPPSLCAQDERRQTCYQSTRERVTLFYNTIVPAALGALWIWKLTIRARHHHEDDREEWLILWRQFLLLYAIYVSPLSNDEATLTPSALPSLFATHVSHTHDFLPSDVRVADMDLDALYRLWAVVMRRSPALVPDPKEYHRFVRVATHRLATLCTTTQPVETLNDVRYAEPAPDGRVMANDELLSDTERVWHYLLEADFVTRFLYGDDARIRPHMHIDQEARREARDPNGTLRIAWEKAVYEAITGQLGVFAHNNLADLGWPRYVYWDEVEHGRRRQHTSAIGPRHVIGQYRRNHTDAINETLQSRSEIPSLWEDARRKREEERQAMDAAGLGGWSFPLLWDYRERSKARAAEASQSGRGIFAGLRIHRDEVTEKQHYIDQATGKLIRGERLERLNLALHAAEISGGLIEANLLEEVALDILLNLDRPESAADKDEAYRLRIMTSDDPDWPLHVHQLLSGGRHDFDFHPIHAHLGEHGTDCGVPMIVAHCNRYAVFLPRPADGAQPTCLAFTTHLSEALLVWVVCTERFVRRKLDQLARQLLALDASLDDGTKRRIVQEILKRAVITTARVPPKLRSIFGLKRDPYLLRLETNNNAPHVVEAASAASSLWDDGDSLVSILKERVAGLPALEQYEARLDHTRQEAVDTWIDWTDTDTA